MKNWSSLGMQIKSSFVLGFFIWESFTAFCGSLDGKSGTSARLLLEMKRKHNDDFHVIGWHATILSEKPGHLQETGTFLSPGFKKSICLFFQSRCYNRKGNKRKKIILHRWVDLILHFPGWAEDKFLCQKKIQVAKETSYVLQFHVYTTYITRMYLEGKIKMMALSNRTHKL